MESAFAMFWLHSTAVSRSATPTHRGISTMGGRPLTRAASLREGRGVNTCVCQMSEHAGSLSQEQCGMLEVIVRTATARARVKHFACATGVT
jgi:hypothetical protein